MQTCILCSGKKEGGTSVHVDLIKREYQMDSDDAAVACSGTTKMDASGKLH